MAQKTLSQTHDVIVIGGSSGAIEALTEILPALPTTLHAAIVVVIHLPPDRRSLLSSIFSQRCAMPALEALDKEVLRPGCIYFAPPDYHVLLDRGPRIALSLDTPVNFSRPSIDVLFESAADLCHHRVIGILLSGANDDGAHGLHAIHAAGGMAVVQTPDSASMPAMPNAALGLFQPTHTLPPQAIAELLVALHQEQLL